MNKICKKCNINKNILDFYPKKSSCKQCTKEYRNQYILKNKEKIKEKAKKMYAENKEKESQKNKERYLKNKKYYIEKAKKYREDNSEKMKEYWKKYRQDERNKKRENKRVNEKYKNDINFKLSKRLRTRMRTELHNKKANKSVSTFTLIGCSVPEFKKWIEYQFDNEMNWENYGTYWNIDHVKPCSSFNLQDKNQQQEYFVWHNMRPMKSIENFKKYDKIDQNIINLHNKIYNKYLSLRTETS